MNNHEIGRLPSSGHLIPDSFDTRHDGQGEAVIGVLAGEGIGGEVTDAALCVLEAASPWFPARVELGGVIGRQALAATGHALDGDTEAFCEGVFAARGAVLCGPAGGRFVYDLRRRFDLYCKLAPVRPWVELSNVGVVRGSVTRGVDLVIVRENAGGIYFGAHGHSGGRSYQESSYTEAEVDRIVAAGLGLARTRRQQLCLVVKAEGLPTLTELWVRRARAAAAEADVELRVLDIDNATYQILACPESFDVVVTANLFGDILVDATAILLGSRGVSYSVNLGDGGRAVYQTNHGAAYDLAGLDVANPIAHIHALVTMLRENFGAITVSNAMEEAIATVLREGVRTADIAEPGSVVVGTRAMAEAIAEEVRRVLTLRAPSMTVVGDQTTAGAPG